MDVTLRSASPGEAAAAIEVMLQAFRPVPGSDRERHTRQLAERWRELVVLEADGELVGAARVVIEPLHYGPAATVRRADIGHVAVRPDRQGEGLGSALMQGVMARIAADGCALARLGGLIRFYARFGFVPFPRRFWDFPLEPVRAGVATLSPEDYLTPPAQVWLRPYHPARDGLERARLYDVCLGGRLGAVVETRPAQPLRGEPDATGLRWVCETGHGLAGWAVANHGDGTAAELTALFDSAHLELAAPLLQCVLRALYRRGATRVTARLPFDPALEAALAGTVPFALREVTSAPASNLLALTDLSRLLVDAAPEWWRRLTSAGLAWTGTLEVHVGARAAVVAFGPDGASLAPPGEADVRLAAGPRDFLLLALGYRGLGELPQVIIEPESARPLLATFLRREPTATGPLG